MVKERLLNPFSKEVSTMMGTCKGCGAENVELNEQGLCANCAAKPGGDAGGDQGGTASEGAM